MMMMMMMMNKGEHWEKADLHSVVTVAYPAELDDSTTNVVRKHAYKSAKMTDVTETRSYIHGLQQLDWMSF